MLSLDRDFDCSIGRFVLDGFVTNVCFGATGDPGAALYRALMQLILRQLGADFALPDEATLVPAEADRSADPSLVARSLGIDWRMKPRPIFFTPRPVRWKITFAATSNISGEGLTD